MPDSIIENPILVTYACPILQISESGFLDTGERAEGSLRPIARRSPVSASLVARLSRHHRSTGSLDPKPHGGGRPSASTQDDLERLLVLVRGQPDAALEEWRRRLGVTCSTMAISPALRKPGLTRKKKILHAREPDSPQVQPKRQEFRDEMVAIDPRRPVLVDESGADTAMTRTHGRAPAGRRVPGSVPGGCQTLTLICDLQHLNRPVLSPPAPSATASL